MRLIKLTTERAAQPSDDPEDEGPVAVAVTTWVNPAQVRSFNARREGPGTRVTFANSSAVVFRESPEEVANLIEDAS